MVRDDTAEGGSKEIIMYVMSGGSIQAFLNDFRGLSRMIGLRANFHLPRRTRRTSDVRKL